MAATRITITVDEDVLNELKSRVGPGEVSGYVVEALACRASQRDPIMEMLDKLDEMYGPLTDEEIEEGRREWKEIERTIVLDAGAVIGLSRNNRRLKRIFKPRARLGIDFRVPTVVVAETVRGNGPRDAPVNLVLAQTSPRYPLTEAIARVAGQLLGAARSSSTVDALDCRRGARLRPVRDLDIRSGRSSTTPRHQVAAVIVEAGLISRRGGHPCRGPAASCAR